MKSDFKKLKNKILKQIFWIIGISLIIGLAVKFLLIDGLLQRPFADWFVDMCMKLFQVDWYPARDMYVQMFRNQKPLLLTGGLLILMIIIFYFSLSQLTKYFLEVIEGISKLLDNSDEVIKLSPEMEFMERKLNSVRDTLTKREKDARESEQRKNDLVVYLAHDIKTPLTSVIGYLNLLDEVDSMPPEQQKKYVQTTLNNALRLEQLINQFFDITRFNLQAIQLDLGEINLTHMLYQITDEFYPIFEKKGITPIINAGEGLILTADADKLARVFRNILKNATVFSNNDTDIMIDAKREDQHIKISFCNKGAVIPKQQLEAVFEKFYRLDASRSTQTGGAGLGLAIAKEIVNAHQGSIYAESSEEKTVFTVILPMMLSTS